jgi:hypothetical protein
MVTATGSAPDMMTAALDYAARGLLTIPTWPLDAGGACTCPKAGTSDCSPGKHPLSDLVPRGLKDGTTDAATIRQWWALWPDANVAIVTGAASGLIVLDIDAGAGGYDTIATLEAEHGELPATWAVETGGGGLHLYFQHPGGYVPNSAGRYGPGLDVRGDGGYIVAPPSLHRSGRRYRWAEHWHPDRLALAWPPGWLMARSAPERGPRRDGPRPALIDGPISEGGRNATLTRIAGALRRQGASEATILAALEAENAARCAPPLADTEVARIAASVARYAPATAAMPAIRGRRPDLGQAVRRGR